MNPHENISFFEGFGCLQDGPPTIVINGVTWVAPIAKNEWVTWGVIFNPRVISTHL